MFQIQPIVKHSQLHLKIFCQCNAASPSPPYHLVQAATSLLHYQPSSLMSIPMSSSPASTFFSLVFTQYSQWPSDNVTRYITPLLYSSNGSLWTQTQTQTLDFGQQSPQHLLHPVSDLTSCYSQSRSVLTTLAFLLLFPHACLAHSHRRPLLFLLPAMLSHTPIGPSRCYVLKESSSNSM